MVLFGRETSIRSFNIGVRIRDVTALLSCDVAPLQTHSIRSLPLWLEHSLIMMHTWPLEDKHKDKPSTSWNQASIQNHNNTIPNQTCNHQNDSDRYSTPTRHSKFHPHLPNSQQILYSTTPPRGNSDDQARSTLWLAETGYAGSARQLTSGTFNDHGPIWHPSGQSVRYP